MNSKTEKTAQQMLQNDGRSAVVSTDFTGSSCSSSVRGAGHYSPLEVRSGLPAALTLLDLATFPVEPSMPQHRQLDDARDVGLLLRDAGDEVYRSYTGRRVESPTTSPGRKLAAIADEFNAEQEWKNACRAASDFVHAAAAPAVAGFLTGLVIESLLM